MRIALFTLALVVGFVSSVQAQDETPHVIDIALGKCLQTAKGTMPRAGCYSQASEAWEKDIIKTYAALLAAVLPDKKPSLEAAQQAWEKFRDAEFNFIALRYAKNKGTGVIATRIILRTDVLKPRALQLEGELSQIKPAAEDNEKVK